VKVVAVMAVTRTLSALLPPSTIKMDPISIKFIETGVTVWLPAAMAAVVLVVGS